MDTTKTPIHRLVAAGAIAASATLTASPMTASQAFAEEAAPATDTPDCSAGKGLILFSYWKFIAENPPCAPAILAERVESLLTQSDCREDRGRSDYGSRRGCRLRR